MTNTAASFGFDLGNREIATLVYLCVFLLYVLLAKTTRMAAFNIVRAFFSPKLLQVWFFMSLYVLASVWLLATLGLWDFSNLKSTLLWWLTVGFTCGFEAQRLKANPQLLGKLVREAFALSAIVLFIVELVSFSLWIEFAMFPALTALALLIVVAENQTETAGYSLTLRGLRGLQMVAGFLIFGSSCWLVATSVPELWSLHTLRSFGLPILLWLMFLPFIFFLAVFMAYEDAFTSLKVRPNQAAIFSYARKHAVLAFGWNIEAVRRLARDIRVRDISDKQEVNNAIKEIKQILNAEKKPPIVEPVDGWSPHAARLFLEEFGIVAGDYHRAQWGWLADSGPVKLSSKGFADWFSFNLAGNASAVTMLRLSLNGASYNDSNESLRAFDQRGLALVAKVFDEQRAADIYALAQAEEPAAIVIDDIEVQLRRSDWGDACAGGYDRCLTVKHPKNEEGE